MSTQSTGISQDKVRSQPNVATLGTPQTPVASPYYVDGRNVTPVVWSDVAPTGG